MTASDTTIRWETVVVGSLFMLVAIYFGYGTITGYWEQSRTAGEYSPVDVQILESKVDQRNLSDATGGGPVRTYQPHIKYQYLVAGESYVSSRYGYMGDYVYDNSEDAQRIVDRDPVGTSQTGFYKESNPAQSVLTRSTPPFPVFIWFCVGFFLLGLVAVIAGLKGKFGGLKSNW